MAANDNKVEKEKWSTTLLEEITMVRIDGVPNIIRSDSLALKIFWLLAFIASGSVCVALICATVHEYLMYEVTTVRRFIPQPIAKYPAITICLVNPFNTDYSVELLAATNKTFRGDYTRTIIDMEMHVKETTGAYMSDEQKRKLSNLTQILMYCKVPGGYCNESWFQWVWHPLYLGCYRFNSGFNSDNQPVEPIVTMMTGIEDYSIIEMQLFAGLPDFWSDEIGTYGQRGFYVFVHNETEYPYNNVPSPVLVTPGLGTFMNIERTFHKQFNQWPFTYSECRVSEENELMGEPLVDGGELFERVRATNYSYSRSNCLSACAQIETVKACKCNNYLIGFRDEAYEDCMNVTNKDCAHVFYYETFMAGDFIKDNCLAKCPLECFQSTLTASLTYFEYPTLYDAWSFFWNSEAFLRMLNKTHDYADGYAVMRNAVSFRLYYNTLAYTMSEETAAMTLDTLIGELGGHLHLFLGMSLLSFIELFELVALGCALSVEDRYKHTGDGKSKKNSAAEKIDPNSTQDFTTI